MPLDALIFIDTNILLDFYRIRNNGVGLELLELIDRNKDKIITGSQVEMEYKKNRQRVVLEALQAQKLPQWDGVAPPAFLAKAQSARVIGKARESIRSQQPKLEDRIAAVLASPSTSDPVYLILQRLFKNKGPYNLSRDKKVRFEIHKAARKRFLLGYPPRKKDVISIGDAVNWEWIIHCASESGKHIVLVTRDRDYGISYNGKCYLNDWLHLEFAERVSRKRKIVLTDRLSEAFRLLGIPVRKEAEEVEDDLMKGMERFVAEDQSSAATGVPVIQ